MSMVFQKTMATAGGGKAEPAYEQLGSLLLPLVQDDEVLDRLHSGLQAASSTPKGPRGWALPLPIQMREVLAVKKGADRRPLADSAAVKAFNAAVTGCMPADAPYVRVKLRASLVNKDVMGAKVGGSITPQLCIAAMSMIGWTMPQLCMLQHIKHECWVLVYVSTWMYVMGQDACTAQWPCQASRRWCLVFAAASVVLSTKSFITVPQQRVN